MNQTFSEEAQIYAIYFNDFIELRSKSEWKPKENKLLVIKDKTYMHIPIKDTSASGTIYFKDKNKHYELLVSWFWNLFAISRLCKKNELINNNA